ncbi:hypothetical protein BJ138DRAFT_1144205, partial [Hygrophoropsis aurantiaca]
VDNSSDVLAPTTASPCDDLPPSSPTSTLSPFPSPKHVRGSRKRRRDSDAYTLDVDAFLSDAADHSSAPIVADKPKPLRYGPLPSRAYIPKIPSHTSSNDTARSLLSPKQTPVSFSKDFCHVSPKRAKYTTTAKAYNPRKIAFIGPCAIKVPSHLRSVSKTAQHASDATSTSDNYIQNPAPVIQNAPNFNAYLHNKVYGLGINTAHTPVLDAYTPQTDAYLPNSDAYVRQSDIHTQHLDAYIPHSDAYAFDACNTDTRSYNILQDFADFTWSQIDYSTPTPTTSMDHSAPISHSTGYPTTMPLWNVNVDDPANINLLSSYSSHDTPFIMDVNYHPTPSPELGTTAGANFDNIAYSHGGGESPMEPTTNMFPIEHFPPSSMDGYSEPLPSLEFDLSQEVDRTPLPVLPPAIANLFIDPDEDPFGAALRLVALRKAGLMW